MTSTKEDLQLMDLAKKHLAKGGEPLGLCSLLPFQRREEKRLYFRGAQSVGIICSHAFFYTKVLTPREFTLRYQVVMPPEEFMALLNDD